MKKFLISSLVLLLAQDARAIGRPLLRSRTKAALAPSGPVSAPPAAPQMVHTHLFRQAVTLLGQTSSSEVSVYIDPWTDRRSAPHLRIPFDVSGIVDPSLSTITFELDNAPILSTTLQKLQTNRTLELSLSGVGGGFHMIRVRTRLLTSSDPCRSLYDRELWLRLSPDSELSYLRVPSENKDEHVGGILSAWQGTRSSVLIQPNVPIQRGSVGAYLQAARWLFQSGLHADTVPQGVAGKALVLRTASSGPDPAIPWEPALLGGLARQGTQLVATARTPDDLETMFLQLQAPDSLAQCTERICLLARHNKARVPAKKADRPDSPRPADAVVTLAQQGLPHGFTARGGGWHQLRLIWERPDSLMLSGEPELRLDVQTAALASLDRNASSLTVKLGDRPLASFSPALLQRESMPLRVRIPKEQWEQKSWAFEVEINLRAVQMERCQSSDDSTLWLTIGATSGIYAQYQERHHPGTLAAIADLAQRHPVQIVYSRTLNWPAVATMSAVLAKLSSRSIWQTVDAQSACGPICILPQVGALPDSSPLALLAVGGQLHWVDRDDSFHLPLLSAEGSVFLDIPKIPPHADSLRKGELLWVHFPLDYHHKQVPDSPDFALLPYGQLVWSHSRWLPLGEASKGELPIADKGPPVAPEAPSRPAWNLRIPRQALDGIWLLGSVGIVYLAVRIAKRRRKPSTVMNF